MATETDDIKKVNYAEDVPASTYTKEDEEERFEVFQRGEGQVDFRTVSWIRAAIIFLKSK